MTTRPTPLAQLTLQRMLAVLLLLAAVTTHHAASAATTHIHVRIHKEDLATAAEGDNNYNISTDFQYDDSKKNAQHAPQLPVFFFHGATDNASVWDNYAKLLAADGRAFHALAFCPDTCSVGSLNQQVTLAVAQIRAILTGPHASRYAAGYLFVGHSQGAVLARAVVEDMDDHKVRALVSLAGPHNGVFYGPQQTDAAPALAFVTRRGPSAVPPALFDFTKYTPADLASGAFQRDFNSFLLFQYPQLQEQVSLLGLARSPLAADWAAASPFLPRINNLSPCDDDSYYSGAGYYYGSSYSSSYPTTTMTATATTTAEKKTKCQLDQKRRRANFLKLAQAHFFGSPGDETIAPWQSAILGKYNDVSCASHIRDRFAHFRVLGFTATDEYTRDTYGLKTLHQRGGALYLHSVPAVAHSCWLKDVAACRFQPIFDKYVYPVFKSADAAAASKQW